MCGGEQRDVLINSGSFEILPGSAIVPFASAPKERIHLSKSLFNGYMSVARHRISPFLSQCFLEKLNLQPLTQCTDMILLMGKNESQRTRLNGNDS